MMTRILAAVSLTLFASPHSAHAQDRWREQVFQQMRVVVETANARGFELTPQYFTGSLRDGRTDVLDLALSASRQYRIVAACDNDCADLDLTVVESDGSELTADLRADSIPVVAVGAGHPGIHRLRVSMASCAVGACRYSVAVFAK